MCRNLLRNYLVKKNQNECLKLIFSSLLSPPSAWQTPVTRNSNRILKDVFRIWGIKIRWYSSNVSCHEGTRFQQPNSFHELTRIVVHQQFLVIFRFRLLGRKAQSGGTVIWTRSSRISRNSNCGHDAVNADNCGQDYGCMCCQLCGLATAPLQHVAVP